MHIQEKSGQRFTVGILGASFGTNNLGIAALTCGTVASICHFCPDARIFLLDYGVEPATYQVMHPGGAATVELVNIRFSKKIYLRNNIAFLLFLALCHRILPLQKWRDRLQQRNSILKSIKEADVICSIAGGDSFSDIYGIRRLIYVALPQILVQLLGKPLVQLPQTFGPFNGTLAKALSSRIIKHSWKVYSRDLRGLEAVRHISGIDPAGVAFGYDMGFVLEPHIRPERMPAWLDDRDKTYPLVGFNISGLLIMGGYTRSNMFGIKADYNRLVQRLIDFFVRECGVHVMIVPHVYGTDEGGESDTIASRKVYDQAACDVKSHLYLIEEKYDQHEIKAIIGRCNFFVGSRMHACIAALSQCIPTVGLAYSNKFHGVFESVGAEKLAIDIREWDETTVLGAVKNAYISRREYREKLEGTIPAVREVALGIFGQIWEASLHAYK